jgi:tRNA(Ile)-lysidine synthase TilS/MesJ
MNRRQSLALAEPLLGITLRALQRHDIVHGGCVIAVSGGPDSMALADAVIELFLKEGSSAPLVISR